MCPRKRRDFELTGKDETDSSLDLYIDNCELIDVVDKAGCLTGNILEDVVDEGVHDGLGLIVDSELGMYMLEDFINEKKLSLISALN